MATYLEQLKQNTPSIEAGQSVEIVNFRPDLAPAFCRCYFELYKDTFPMKYVYEPEQVCAAVEAGELLPLLVVTPKGEVVALSSAFHFGPNKRAWEVGGTMVIEAYRKGDLARPLLERVYKECQARQADSIYGSAVCNHIYTQYAGRKLGFKPTALDLEGFTNFEAGVSIETSLLYCMRVYNMEPRQVYLPSRYEAFAREIYQHHQLERTIICETCVSAGESVMSAQKLSRSLRITVARLGSDLVSRVAETCGQHPECEAIQICLPMEQAGMAWAAESLRGVGFFLSGILPLWAASDSLVLQRTKSEPDYAKVALCEAFAKRLLAVIREDRASLVTPS